MKEVKKIKKVVAAFDFDCTITTKDTLLPFLYSLHSLSQNVFKSAQLFPTLVAYKAGWLDNHTAKENLLKTFLKGKNAEEVKAAAEDFSRQQLSTWVKPEALKRLQWHQMQGHHCILISAGLEVYLASWAKNQGFEAILATQLEVKNNVITGKIEGRNCFGEEKVNRLLANMGTKENFDLYAYGDSRGDKELLALADYSYYRVMPNDEN